MNSNFDIIIIGAGPAGLTAALYAKRYGNNPLVLERSMYGGQIISTPEVENYPGIKTITGVQLAMSLFEQITELGVEVFTENIETLDLSGKNKVIKTNKDEYTAPVVIIANGAKRRKLGCKGEDELNGRGVSYCATCDGAFYKNEDVVIVGGGNTALEDALFLSNQCTTVHLIHRRDSFRGNNILIEAVKKRENIKIHYDSIVSEIVGKTAVESVDIKNVKTDTTESLKATGIFIAVGLEPENSLFGDQLKLDSYGYIIAGEDCKTNLDGVFAAGDSRTKGLRQIVTAAADGAVAAFEASNMLNSAN